jgi:hypothetical protein
MRFPSTHTLMPADLESAQVERDGEEQTVGVGAHVRDHSLLAG